MNKIILIIGLCLMMATSALAGDFVFHNDGVITGKRSSCGKACSSRVDALRIDRETFDSLTRWHKVVDDEVVEMTQGEKDAILQAESDAQAQAIEDALDRFEVSNVELIMALIQRINVRINDDITKAEIIQQIKDNR